MDLPVLMDGERWRVQSPSVYVKSTRFDAFLTDRRVILKSPYDPLMPDKDLALDRIEGLEESVNSVGEPVLAILAKTARGESRRLVLTFAGKSRSRSRMDERDDWVRNIPVNPPAPATGPARTIPKVREQRDYDPGKLVFSQGICDAGTIPPPKKEINLVIRDVRKNNFPPRFSSGVPDVSPEIHTPDLREARTSDRAWRSPDAPPREPRTVRPAAQSGEASFSCLTCGSRIIPGSRYCDRCGAKIIPADLVMRGTSRDHVAVTGLPGAARNSDLRFMDEDPRYVSRRQIVLARDPDPSSSADGHGIDNGLRVPSRAPFSLFGWSGRKSQSGKIGEPACRTTEGRRRAPVSRQRRFVYSVATIAMIACIATGIFILVSPVGFARLLGAIIPAGVFSR
ncbi:MAG: hypothetical protein M0R30_13435 [Methanoregula sp.]|uniref:hypothetical protein n=1 Tax=Methanoregula sp. TaxID=2052170 RepID=UPI0025EF3215|nr:hypothetical protein [Methanoregula sp.]MCK9632628.1 hypothetical protein [Methanoregula sp.]